ncbi:MAG TPA: hypothetical protein DE036_04355 [Actinobacteria bacterium]|nr:hypothetical protein [Actinomycetota bacterium]
MTRASTKRVKTVRLEQEDYEKISMLAKKTHKTESQIIRESISLGIVDLISEEEEDELLRRRLSQKTPDVDGKTFIEELKQELGI